MVYKCLWMLLSMVIDGVVAVIRRDLANGLY